jgi:hypothetical protein
MAWDSTRPVPWRRLVREWIVYAVIMVTVFGLFFRASVNAGAILGLAASLPMYLVVGTVLAKLGYQRQSLRRPSPSSSSSDEAPSSATRRRPPPTRRTSTGPTQHPRRTKNRRR